MIFIFTRDFHPRGGKRRNDGRKIKKCSDKEVKSFISILGVKMLKRSLLFAEVF